jgi:hypothetical protein
MISFQKPIWPPLFLSLLLLLGTHWGCALRPVRCGLVCSIFQVQRTAELISLEPRAPRAPSRMAVTPRNPSEKGKRGGCARTHRGPVDGGGSHWRRHDLLLLSPPPFARVAAAVCSCRRHVFHDQKHKGSLMGENTRGRELMGREV